MANEEHVALLKQGVVAWNEWRRENPDVLPDLRGTNLRGEDLRRAALHLADLRLADLRRAALDGANLSEAHLGGANLSEATLRALGEAHLAEARTYMLGTNLTGADLTGANLRRADLTGAGLRATVFGDIDLSEVTGLDQCEHRRPSIIDHQTLQRSGPLPLVFLHGVGLPDNLIEYLPSLLNQPIQFYSCFISYSTKDQEFAERLHADLQNKGVRCWFAPHDLPIGAKTWDAIDEAIRLRDKVLLILSKGAIESDWVEDEVSKAFAEERKRKQIVLFPIRKDNTVMMTDEPWARKLRDQRNIGDLTRWKDHDAYQKSFERLMRDLTVQQASKS